MKQTLACVTAMAVAVAHYRSTGSIDEAASFVCAAP
jgi:hypothetical protein